MTSGTGGGKKRKTAAPPARPSGRRLPSHLLIEPQNAELIRYLEETSPSAHSDVTSEMVLAAGGLRDVHSSAPDPRAYSYEVLHTTDGVIFCAAIGQSTLLFRIPERLRRPDLRGVGAPFPGLGPDWIAVPAFAVDVPLAQWRQRLKELCRLALTSAS